MFRRRWFYSTLGVKLLEILENCDMINKTLITVSRTEKHYELTISNDKFLTSLKTNKIYCLPTKLPMLVKPKEYGDNKLGGYLLNDIEFKEKLFIEKKTFSVGSELISIDIYTMVNNINSVSFTIKNELLDYLSNNSLLLDPNEKHEYGDLDKRTKIQDNKLES